MLDSCAMSAGDSRPALSSRRNSFGGARSNFVDVPLPLEPLAPLQPLDGWHASPPMPGQIKVRRGAGFNRQAQLVASGDAKGYQQPSTSHAITTTIWSFVVTLAFGLGVGITAIAGGLLASNYSFQPYVGLEYVIVMYAGVVLGGLGSVGGAFFGGLTIGLVQQLSTLILPSQLQNTAIFVVFLAIILLRPQGLFGKAARRA